jgi:hypothetical protein
MFGKACRFQAIDLEKLGADLQKLATRKRREDSTIRIG